MLTLLVGPPGSGKSTVAKAAALSAREVHGLEVLVLDPRRDPAWARAGAALVTSDPDELMAVALACDAQGRPATVRCLVVVEECGWSLPVPGAFRPVVEQLAGQHRHHGHSVLAIAHRYHQLPPGSRAVADRLYLWRQADRDAKEAAADWAIPELAEAMTLPPRVALIVTRSDFQVRRFDWSNTKDSASHSGRLPG